MPKHEVLESQVRGAWLRLEVNQRHTVQIISPTRLLVIVGGCFETNKSFATPPSRVALRKICGVCREKPESKVLIVGHTDTTGTPDVNDKLSLERARSIQALLERNVDTWLGYYENTAVKAGIWGRNEDTLMLGTVIDYARRNRTEDPIRWFQGARSLKVDGIAGRQTRTRLIEEYFESVHTSEHDAQVINAFTAHGCGEAFPLDEGGKNVDATAADNQADATDRRVEFFVFPKGKDITPAPPGKTSGRAEGVYLQWRGKSKTDAVSVVRLSGSEFRVRLTARGKPMKNEPFELFSDGAIVTTGNTSDDGDVISRLFEESAQVDLVLTERGITRTFSLLPQDSFPPPAELAGARIRLCQLGFLPGPVDLKAEEDEATRHAVERFKQLHGLAPNSERDDAFVNKLKEEYGS